MDSTGVAELKLHRSWRAAAQPLDGVDQHESAVLDDRHPVGRPLYLVQLVRGQEHRSPVVDGLAEQVGEFVLQQRVQT